MKHAALYSIYFKIININILLDDKNVNFIINFILNDRNIFLYIINTLYIKRYICIFNNMALAKIEQLAIYFHSHNSHIDIFFKLHSTEDETIGLL